MNGVLRAGLIGLGNISGVHISALEALPNAVITAVCDLDENKLASFPGDVHRFTDYRQLVSCPDVDVVHILTPHFLHAEMTIAALKAGKHVVCEKPMASETEDALRMMDAEKASSGTLSVIFQNRYNASSEKLRKIALSGEAGRFLGSRAVICWHRTREYYESGAWRGKWATEGGGLLINQSIHTLDLMIHIFGPVRRVKGHVSTDVLDDCIEVEDNVHAVFEYESGASGVIFASNSYVTDAPVMLEAVFEKAVYQLQADRLFRLENGVPVLIADEESASSEGKICWGSGHKREIAEIYRAINEGRRFEIDGRSAFPALSLVKAIYQSSKENRWVEPVRP